MLKKRLRAFPVVILPVCLLTMCCKGNPEREAKALKSETGIPEPNEAQKLVIEAMNHAGGRSNWNSKKTFSYTKNIQSYDSTGSLLRTVAQVHRYQLKPSFKANIQWKDNGAKHEIINNGKQTWKLVDGEIQEDMESVDSAWNSSFGSHYMVSMPFKLADPGTILDYKGLDTLSNQEIVHKLKVTYEKGAGSSGGMHTWYYFLNTENFLFEANFLDHGKGYTWTDYETFVEVGGILLTEKRRSYASNARLDKRYLKTIYHNTEMQFDVELPEALFKVDR